MVKLPLRCCHWPIYTNSRDSYLHKNTCMMISDEVAIETCVNYKRFWPLYDTHYEHPYVCRFTKSGCHSVKDWWAISFYEKLLLYWVNGNLEQNQYADILEQYTFPVLENLDLTLIQDEYKSHTASSIKDLIGDSGRSFNSASQITGSHSDWKSLVVAEKKLNRPRECSIH